MDCPNNFYITCFSDVDRDKYSNNNSTDFTNSLPLPIDTSDGQYEIGLKHIRFQSKTPAPTNLGEETSQHMTLNVLKGPLVGPQLIKIWKKSRGVYTYKTPYHITHYNAFLTGINEFLKTTKLKLSFYMSPISDTEEVVTVDFEMDKEHWLDIPAFFSKLIGQSTTRLFPGKIKGKPVPISLYNELGEPQSVILEVCHLYLIEETMKPPIEFGFEPFLHAWADELEKSAMTYGTEIGLIHEYVGNNIFLEVICYDADERMQISPEMNKLLTLPDQYVFERDTSLIFPLKNFEPIVPPIPPTPIIIDPEKFTYIICDISESQVIAGRHVSSLAVLAREPNLTIVSKEFESVSYTPLKRQLVNAIRIKITNRDLICLPTADRTIPTYCMLHIRRS
jgi:hypothetical protein